MDSKNLVNREFSNKLIEMAADALHDFPNLYELWQRQGWEIFPVHTKQGTAVFIDLSSQFQPNDESFNLMRRMGMYLQQFNGFDVKQKWYHC